MKTSQSAYAGEPYWSKCLADYFWKPLEDINFLSCTTFAHISGPNIKTLETFSSRSIRYKWTKCAKNSLELSWIFLNGYCVKTTTLWILWGRKTKIHYVLFFSQCIEIIVDKIAKTFNKIYAGLNLQRFPLHFTQNSFFKGIESTSKAVQQI